jgi:radical SAM superfamily enzyme YgiQ (UPF0313 family)
LIQALQKTGNLRRVNGVSYIKSGKVINTNESPELDFRDMPSPSYEFLEVEGYDSFNDATGEQYPYVPILGSKGCPYSCIYCPYPIGFGKKWMYRSPQEIADEIEYLHHVRKVKGFLLRDQSFTLNKKQATKICDEIIRRKLDIAWFCEARVDEISRELMQKMKKSGCKRIHFGVETGDPEILKIAKPGVELGTIKKAFRLAKEMGFWTNAHVILGWPNDNYETIKKTYRFILYLNPDGVNWNVLTPYPGTKIYEIAQRDSLIISYDWSNYTSHTIVMRTKNLSENQLYRIQKRIIYDFSKRQMLKLLLNVLHGEKQYRLLFSEARRIFQSYIADKIVA